MENSWLPKRQQEAHDTNSTQEHQGPFRLDGNGVNMNTGPQVKRRTSFTAGDNELELGDYSRLA